MSGGSVTSEKFKEASEKVRVTAKKNSFIIGLIPSKNSKESVSFLFEREKERNHFKNMNLTKLFEKVEKSFNRFPKILNNLCDKIIYTKGKSKEEIVKEIMMVLK